MTPECLPYPKINELSETNELRNKFCYVFKKYPLNGYILLIIRKSGDVFLQFYDFAAKQVDINKNNKFIMQILEQSPKIVSTMKYIGIPEALFYYSSDKDISRLVDIRLSFNKFVGPGYLADFFGRQAIPIQEVVTDPLILTDNVWEEILNKTGIFASDLIVKTSAFKTIIRGSELLPLYGVHHAAKPIK